ncbi:MAG: WGR domain-containing protein [Tannerellaceae bacterium]|nr:WGR domain-containing protein [Tannerellaceae bacterium]
MKLIQQSKLYFKEDTSDKVYEIDLCQLGENEYLVNFRYGRRGTTLKEGTKTVAAVNREEGEKIFSDLENEKRRKGYQTEIETFIELPSLAAINPDSQPGVILQRLQDSVEGKNSFKTEWKTSRVIWKAMELNIREAIPFIIKLAGKGDDFQKYAALYTLTVFRVESAEPVFTAFANQSKGKAHIRHIAYEGLLTILRGEELQAVFRQLLDKLPAIIQQDIQKENTESLSVHIEEMIQKGYVDFLTPLYLISRVKPALIPVVSKILQKLPLEAPFFRSLRSIYKLASLRKDLYTLAVLSYHFEQGPAEVIDMDSDKQEKGMDEFAFSIDTKRYFQKNILNYLRKTAEKEGAKEYLKLALSILTQYKEADYSAPVQKPESAYGNWNYLRKKYAFRVINYPECYDCLLLSNILFGNDPDRKLTDHLKYYTHVRVVFSSNYYYNPALIISGHDKTGTNGNKESFWGRLIKRLFGIKDEPVFLQQTHSVESADQPEEIRIPRYEIYPEYWDSMPEAYIQLLIQAKMKLIHEFTYRNLKNHAEFQNIQERFREKEILLLLNSDFETPHKLGFEILMQRSITLSKDKDFVCETLNCQAAGARQWAREQINANPGWYTEDINFLTSLIYNNHPDNDKWIKELLQNTRFTQEREEALLGKVVTGLLQLQDSPENNQLAQTAIKRLTAVIGTQLNKISWDIVEQLIVSPLVSNILLASHITVEKATRISASDIPVSLVNLFLRNPMDNVRENGIQLFDRYPEHILTSKTEFLINLLDNPFEDVLTHIVGKLRRVMGYNNSLKNTVTRQLLYGLIRKEKFEGSHLLLKDFFIREMKSSWNTALTPKDITKLVHAQYRESQLTGYEVLTAYNRPDDFTLGQIISFGKHELLVVRQWCWNYYKQNTSRIRQEKRKALGLLDSPWEDTRTFAFHFFKTSFTETDWDIDTLISIVDSVRPDVESFGKELISHYFKPELAPVLLAKLSEHPGIQVQSFISGYLELYASGKKEIIQDLGFYFRSILTQVNKARVAKDRIFKFLHAEGLKDPTIAEVIVPLLDDISAQSTVQDKEKAIHILKEMKELCPHLDMHLTIKN